MRIAFLVSFLTAVISPAFAQSNCSSIFKVDSFAVSISPANVTINGQPTNTGPMQILQTGPAPNGFMSDWTVPTGTVNYSIPVELVSPLTSQLSATPFLDTLIFDMTWIVDSTGNYLATEISPTTWSFENGNGEVILIGKDIIEIHWLEPDECQVGQSGLEEIIPGQTLTTTWASFGGQNSLHSLDSGTFFSETTSCAACNTVPTLSQWGFIVLGLLVLCLGAIAIWHRQSAKATT